MVGNAEESGTTGVVWPTVLAKIALKKTIGLTENKEHGVPSLVAWAMRKTGPGTSYSSVGRTDLIIFILEHKSKIIEYLNNGDVDGLINYMVSTSTESGTKDVDWKKLLIILRTKDNCTNTLVAF
ncbi:uncharacterized protein LOC128395839 [Panonychus citri]|uniref:uncharacterized protein LOC128395839 n=1 Tax=Panonychus citri TaxID=50023 RepID=UPI0023080F3C|nr:uncharacterized protein LOC128395839 [Panonychus citri]